MIELRLHGSLWKTVSTTRAEEWRRALDEINADNDVHCSAVEDDDEPALELVRPPDETYHFRVYRNGFDLVTSTQLDGGELSRFFDEYGATIRQMALVDRDAPVRGFEALDYAKRVVHDEAAQFIIDSLRESLKLELADARRLFTLVFLVGTDIPEELVKYHRFHQ